MKSFTKSFSSKTKLLLRGMHDLHILPFFPEWYCSTKEHSSGGFEQAPNSQARHDFTSLSSQGEAILWGFFCIATERYSLLRVLIGLVF